MYDITLWFIVLCFIVKILFWVKKLGTNKKTVNNKGGGLLRFIFYFLIVVFIYLNYNVDFFSKKVFPEGLYLKIIADAVTFVGLLIMLWARNALSRNWSANIVIKENHELVTSGPYSFVRHPIYTGLSLMVLGVVLYANSVSSIIFFVIFVCGACYKAMIEEKLLTKHFGEKYLNYSKETKMLIPFIF